MNALDMIVLLILLVALVRGLMRGLVNTVFSLAAWILAFIVGKWGALIVAPLLPLGTGGESLRYFVGFSVVFLVVLAVVLMLGHFLTSAANAVGLGSADKVLGGALGLLKGCVIVVGLTLAAGLTSLPRTDFWRQAALSGMLEKLAVRMLPLIPADIAKHVRFE